MVIREILQDNELLLKLIMQFESDRDRVLYLTVALLKYSLPEKNKEQKSTINSEKYRKIGNERYIYKSNDKAMEMYNMSIAYAPNNSRELSIAYANRSGLLFRLEKYEECLSDIQRCLELDYPDRLKIMILLRKLECLVLLGRKAEASDVYDETLKWINDQFPKVKHDHMKMKLEEVYEKKQIERKQEPNYDSVFAQFEYSSTNPEAPVASDAVALEYNDTRGRHLVATRDIQSGEFLIKERPYLDTLLPERRYKNCWNCFKQAWACVPCDHCVYVIFCSEQCKEESWNKCHDIECKVLPHVIEEDLSHQINVYTQTLRMAILAVKEIGSVDKLMEELKDVAECKDPRTKGFSSDGIFHSNKYRSLSSHIRHVEKDSDEVMFEKLLLAVFMTYYLGTQTNIFGEILPPDILQFLENEKFIFMAGLIFRNMGILDINGFLTNAAIYDGEIRSFTLMVQSISSFMSLVNHCCKGNTTRIYRQNMYILYATSFIKKGEEITTCYIADNYHQESRDVRRLKLMQQFRFVCQCQPCRENWPPLTNAENLQNFVKYCDNLATFKNGKNKARLLKKFCDSANSRNMMDSTINTIFNQYYDLQHDL